MLTRCSLFSRTDLFGFRRQAATKFDPHQVLVTCYKTGHLAVARQIVAFIRPAGCRQANSLADTAFNPLLVLVFLVQVRNQGLGCKQQAGNTGRIA